MEICCSTHYIVKDGTQIKKVCCLELAHIGPHYDFAFGEWPNLEIRDEEVSHTNGEEDSRHS